MLLAVGLACWLPIAGVAWAQFANDDAEHPAISYSDSAPTDTIARLQQRIDAGDATLEYDDRRGYLPALLRQLDVPVSSQGLVFSRTSLQGGSDLTLDAASALF